LRGGRRVCYYFPKKKVNAYHEKKESEKMYTCKYPELFSPIELAGTLFRNRIFASPTGGQPTYYKNRPIPEYIAYYERKATGGAASVCIGDAMPDSEHALANGSHIMLDDPGVKPQLNKLSEAIRRHGAVAAIEISHGGSSARISYGEGHKIYGPVECDSESFGLRIHAEAMDEAMMKHTIEKFAAAALFAKQCGFGMITLHGGHGWLLHQFMSPTLNTRTDEWGGSFEKRMRFPLAVVDAVRRAVGPKFPLEIRISGSECYEGGYDVDYGIKIAKALEGKVDLIHVSAGSHEDSRVFTLTHPSMFLEDGVNVKYAAEIKKHVNTPVATVGALSDPEQMEEIIRSGKADVVELARGLICDPDLPSKAREGRDGEIVKCIRCFTCFSGLMSRGQFSCALNPEMGSEAETKYARPAARREKVLIAGGGIAGMQAALTAKERGHEVILCESLPQLGGVLRCEKDVPFKKHLEEYIDRQVRMINAADIDVRLNTAVTPELARSIRPDAIIAAIGAEPVRPPVRGIDGGNVIGALEAYNSPEKAGKRIVILGGGLVGCELAIYMAGLGREVTIMEMAPALNDGGNILHGQAIGIELERLGVKRLLSTAAAEISESGLTGLRGEEKIVVPADTVIYAAGLRPKRAEALRLALCAPEFYQIGDCNAAANIHRATNAAYFTALDIGRL
jgi:2,4-dienoyl-CoA reductase-like NADH-dependent reductase (Old Yellow Enzyme family)/thioredoxin reductase